MYNAGHEVVSVLAIIGLVKLSYVGCSRSTNRKQLWRYLIKLSKESSSIQLCYNLYTISVCHGFAEIINDVVKLSRSSELEAQGLPVGAMELLPWLRVTVSECDSVLVRYGLQIPLLVGHVGF